MLNKLNKITHISEGRVGGQVYVDSWMDVMLGACESALLFLMKQETKSAMKVGQGSIRGLSRERKFEIAQNFGK